MPTAEYQCIPRERLFALKTPIGTNISLDDSVMQAGGARHVYDTPLLPPANLFTGAQLYAAEEIVLGILSLFIISLLSSLVYDFLLRAGTNHTYSTRAISIAAALESVERWGFNPRPMVGARHERGETGAPHHPDARHARVKRVWIKGIVAVLVIALATFSMEVALIAATQEHDDSVSGAEIGFVLTTPVVTHWGMGQFLRRNAPTRPCVTPAISGGPGEWKASVQTCFTVNYTDDVARNISYAGRMLYSSTYHRQGSDHFLASVDRNVTYSLGIRTKVYRQDAGPVEVLRQPIERERETALAVHITAPIYFATNMLRDANMACDGITLEPLQYSHRERHEIVEVGQLENGEPVREEAAVYTTEFELETGDIDWWMVQALGSAAASAGISLTDKPEYRIGKTGKMIVLEDIMYVTKKRRFGTATLAFILLALLVLKLIVRKWFQPLSLFEVARVKALETAGLDPLEGMRDESRSIGLDMDRYRMGQSALYYYAGSMTPNGNPTSPVPIESYDFSYEEAGSYYVDGSLK